MSIPFTRRGFLKTAGLAGLSVGTHYMGIPFTTNNKGKKVGIIGLDTSHSPAFAKTLFENKENDSYKGYYVAAAYPYGSRKIATSFERIPEYRKQVEQYGVEIVSSIDELIKKSDVILLETNDGSLHLEQARLVFESGKTVFIDKPVAANYADVVTIYELADKHNVPMFSSSSLRYINNAAQIREGKYGKILGATTFSPAKTDSLHTELFWYGIHGVELLYTIMGVGCRYVQQVGNGSAVIVSGYWEDGRIGNFRGIREGKQTYGGIAFCEKENVYLDGYSGYNPLLKQITEFFESGKSPVDPAETLEIYAFMHACFKSSKQGGKKVSLPGK